jgi:hypothetical protein
VDAFKCGGRVEQRVIEVEKCNSVKELASASDGA